MRHYTVAINHFAKIGSVTHAALRATVGNDDTIWHASLAELSVDGVSRHVIEAFIAWRATQNPEKIFNSVLARNMTVVTIDDDTYPALLKTIHDPPFTLYVRGKLPPHDALCIGVVGSRAATPYGLRVASELSGALAAKGIVIVSGLAWGIDEAAHKATVDVGGITIAILGCGLDGNDAQRKKNLAEKIIALGGAIISEFPPEMPSLPQNFPIRNRIISGMSKGVLVVEAAEKSGSLITARAAIAENREVFAVPGPITSPTSEGTNHLCKDGAHLVTEARDILEVLGVDATLPPTLPPQNLDTTSQAVYDVLSREPLHVDDIARATNLSSSIVTSTLALLEIKGHIRNTGGMCYTK